MLRRLIVAAAAALALLAGAAPAHARIVFSVDDSIRTIDADGSDQRTVVESGAGEPDWSPDGGSIAFVRGTTLGVDLTDEEEESLGDVDELGSAQIWVAAADGGGARALTNPGENTLDRSPTWSPDGRRVAFVRIRFSDDDALITSLMTVSSSGGDERTVTEIKSEDYVGFLAASWSPDGARLLASLVPFFGEEEERLETVDLADGKRRLLLRNASFGEWSPGGDRIAYVGDRRNCDEVSCRELHVANADGGGRRRLLTNTATEYTPAWSADGTRIIFASDRNLPAGGNTELYSITTGGACLTWLTNGTGEAFDPDFAPGAPVDYGACGPVPREPLIEADTSAAAAYTRVPLWWVGPRFGNVLLAEVDTEHGVDFVYDDCADFDPAKCGAPFILVNLPVCTTSVLYEGTGRNVARYQGALVHTPPLDAEDGPQFFIGPTSAFVVRESEDEPGVGAAALRGFPDTSPPAGGLPRAKLPLRFWRHLERTRAAVRKYGVKRAARRLGRSSRRVSNAIALDRRLRRLGPFGRLDCAKR